MTNQDSYAERHYYDNQIIIEGIPINPEQRYNFNMTAHDDRPDQEVEEWWNKPYIVTQGIGHDSYKEYAKRCQKHSDIETKAEFNSRRKGMIQKFLLDYPNGFKYIVRCLDGGAWDRSTKHGEYNSLESALMHAKGM